MNEQDATGERIVYVKGSESNLMEGDPDRADPRYKDRALPQLLHEGWTVKMIGVEHVILTGKATPVPSPVTGPEPIVYHAQPRSGGSGRGRGYG